MTETFTRARDLTPGRYRVRSNEAPTLTVTAVTRVREDTYVIDYQYDDGTVFRSPESVGDSPWAMELVPYVIHELELV